MEAEAAESFKADDGTAEQGKGIENGNLAHPR